MHAETLAARRRHYLLARVVVSRHYRMELTLAMVARAVSSSPRQLQRAYAQFGEMTFREDLLARRMAVAADLLIEQRSIPVRDVARLVGYRQAPHFARVFRRRYGLSPAGFRERARQTEDRRAPATGSAPSSASAPGSRSRISVPPPGAGRATMLPPC
jgi:AraC-like DNA-binding protein